VVGGKERVPVLPDFLRATYDDERESYVSDEARWVDGGPSLEYSFTLLDLDDSDTLEGALEKSWYDPEEGWLGEARVFGEFADAEAFKAEVIVIRAEAEARAEADNIDTLLCVIDDLKERAIDGGLEDEWILEVEGWFEDGPEDAYTLREYGNGERLHHHVEREDECWRLHVKKVIDEAGQRLGWAVFTIYFPELPLDASHDDVLAAVDGRVLMLEQCREQLDARLALRGVAYFMDEGDRVDDPDYAYVNDTDVLSGLACDSEVDAVGDAVWRDYQGDALHDFLRDDTTFVCPREDWQPREKSLVDRFFEENPQPVWLEDQMRALLADEAGVEEEVDPDSPWNVLGSDENA
jgi:hypothetical protein